MSATPSRLPNAVPALTIPDDVFARAVVENVIEGIVVIDSSGRIGQVNPAAAAMFGYAPEDLIGRNVSCLMGQPHAETHDGYILDFLATGRRGIIGIGREVEARRRDGTPIPVDLSVVHLQIAGGDYFVGVMRDLSERQEQEARDAFNHRLGDAVGHAWDQFVAANRWSKKKLFTDALHDLLVLSDSRGGFVGEVLTERDGRSTVQLVASTANNVGTVLEREDPRVAALFAGAALMIVSEGAGAPFLAIAIRAGNRLVGVIGLQGRNAGYAPALVEALSPLTGALGSIIVGLHKVEAQRAAERDLYRTQERLRELATRDPLTNLLNRAALSDALDNGFERSRALGLAFSVLFVDVDHFKEVNDAHGHAAGDAVLRAVAKAMHVAVRPQDLVGRYGGEEFVVGLLETDTAAAAAVAERIRASVMTMPSRIPVTVSIGLASLDDTTGKLDMLLAEADRALYRAKSNGRNRVEVAD